MKTPPATSILQIQTNGMAKELKMAPPIPLAPQPGDLDLRPIFNKLKERWYVLLACMALFFGAAFLYVKASPNIYEAYTTILLEDQSSGSKRAEELLEMLEIRDHGINIDDEIGLIKSYNIVERTMERLDFAVS
jgi:uncharacterized protein involved in exopolysaccharide biosynthesis